MRATCSISVSHSSATRLYGSSQRLLGMHLFQRAIFVHRDMIGLVTPDLVLWIVHAGMMGISLVIGVSRMHLDDLAADMACLRIPGHVIANLESRHDECPLFGSACSAQMSGRAGTAVYSMHTFMVRLCISL